MLRILAELFFNSVYGGKDEVFWGACPYSRTPLYRNYGGAILQEKLFLDEILSFIHIYIGLSYICRMFRVKILVTKNSWTCGNDAVFTELWFIKKIVEIWDLF